MLLHINYHLTTSVGIIQPIPGKKSLRLLYCDPPNPITQRGEITLRNWRFYVRELLLLLLLNNDDFILHGSR